MAKVYYRLCIKSIKCTDDFTIERGKEYLTTRVKNGLVTVLSRFWVHGVDVSHFHGRRRLGK